MAGRSGLAAWMVAGVLGCVQIGVMPAVDLPRAHAAGTQDDDLAPAPSFKRVSFNEARALAKSTGKPLVAVFTASWCGPCHLMQRTVWRERNVEAWINTNAVAVLVDIDQDKATARALGVQAVPTTMVFVNDQMSDRTTGQRDAGGMLGWLSRYGSATGNSAAPGDSASPVYTAPGPSSMAEAEALMRNAQAAAAAGRVSEATTAYARSWAQLGMASRAGVEMNLRELVTGSPEAKRAAMSVRDQVQAAASGSARTFDDLEHWLMLCDVCDDRGQVLRWYDALQNDPAQQGTIGRLAPRLAMILISGGRGAAGASMVGDAAGYASARHAKLVGGGAAQRKAGIARFREDVGRLYGALASAGRAGECPALAQRALQLDDTAWMRIVLVRRAVDGGFASSQHAAWLDQAAKAGAKVDDLKARLGTMASVQP